MDQKIYEIVSAKLRGALAEIQVPGDVTPATPIYGRNSALDSTQLVSLVVDIEEDLHTEFGVEVSLVDERAMSQTRSPFRDVAALCQYIEAVIGERK